MKIRNGMVALLTILLSSVVFADEANTSTASANGYTWRFVKAGVDYGWPYYTSSMSKIVGGCAFDDDWNYYHNTFVNSQPSGTVTIPSVLGGETITGIGAHAFKDCNAITTINIPANITSIDWSSFYTCTGLASVVVSSGNSSYCSYDGVVYDKIRKTLLFCPRAKKSVTIMPSATSIGSQAFLNCNGITSIDIPASITNISDGAFQNCENLVNVTLHDGLVKIGESSFKGCYSLWSVDIPATVTTIGARAFQMCRSLDSVTIPSSVKSIGDGAFAFCLSLTYAKSAIWSTRVYNDSKYVYLWLSQTAYSDDGWGGCDIWDSGYHCVSSDYYYDNNSEDGIDYYCHLYTNVSLNEKYRFYPTKCKTPTIVSEIPDGATFVDLSGNTAVTSVDLPDSVTAIPAGAFQGCANLTSIKLTEAIDNIPANAFNGCAKLSAITIPAAVTNIGASAFSGCRALSRVDVGDLSKWLRMSFANKDANPLNCGGRAYTNGCEITSVKFPDDIVDVGSYLFAGWSGLQSIELSPKTRSIGVCAFSGCSGFENIKIPSSVTNIGTSAFEGCSGLVRVDTDDLAMWCGIAFGNNTANPLYYGKHLFLNGSELTELNVPVDVSSIADYAFYNASSIGSVTIPSSVTNIGANAFTGCTGIRAIEIPASYVVSTVFPSAYTAITNAVISEGAATIAFNGYSGCASLTKIKISSSVTNIGTSAFEGCSGLVRVDIADLVKWYGIAFGNATANPLYYGKHLFLNGSEIAELNVPADVSSIADYAFYNATSIESVTIPSSVTNIGANAFTGCTGIRAIEIPASYVVSTVFPSAYAAITNAVIPEGATTIAFNGYNGCASLTKIDIPSSVTNIGASAFERCSGLVRVDIADLVKWYGIAFGNATANPLYYGKHIFLNGSELTELNVPADVSSIADYAFYNATSIESVTIPSSVTSIGKNAFTGCTGIRTIDIPSSYNVATVFPDAYDAVTKLIIPDWTTTIAANAYRGCSSVTAVEVPASVTTIGSSAFQNCSSLKSVTFKGQAPACGDNVFTGTSADMVVYAGTGTSGWTQWNGRPLAFVDVGGGSEEPEVVEKAQLTVTNVVVHYVVNSVIPEKVYPPAYDTGFINIITEVKSGGAVSVPATWMVNYPDYVSKFGGDFTKSLMKPTGKYDAANNPMFVWQDYVAGTDPTDEEDVFKASITMDENGMIVVSYTPELSDEEKSKRQYTTYGKKSLTDKDWVVVPSGSEADYNFFKVTVEMK